jgi:uncharacterized protein
VLFNGTRSYNYFGDYLLNKYGCRVFKIPIDAGFSCPNRDGTLDSKGCVFCSEGSSSWYSDNRLSVSEQISNVRKNYVSHGSGTKYIAYFQAFTNTYAPLSELKRVYDEAVSSPDIIGLMIGTRPDCISNEISSLIADYRKDGFELWVELGMQSIYERSLAFLNRHHTHDDTIKAVQCLRAHNIKTCVHVILGIPGERWEDIMNTAKFISENKINGVKIHHLHIIKGTELENIYNEKQFSLPERKEYISLLADFIERLPAETIVHRISGDKDEDNLIAPRWSLYKGTVQNDLVTEFKNRGTWQGFLKWRGE